MLNPALVGSLQSDYLHNFHRPFAYMICSTPSPTTYLLTADLHRSKGFKFWFETFCFVCLQLENILYAEFLDFLL